MAKKIDIYLNADGSAFKVTVIGSEHEEFDIIDDWDGGATIPTGQYSQPDIFWMLEQYITKRATVHRVNSSGEESSKEYIITDLNRFYEASGPIKKPEFN